MASECLSILDQSSTDQDQKPCHSSHSSTKKSQKTQCKLLTLMQSHAKTIINPMKFLPIFFNHRLEGDLLLYDHAVLNEKGEVRGLLSNFNSCKQISSVTFDHSTGVTSCKTTTNENKIFTPFQMMVQRLKSQGDVNAYKLSQRIKRMGDFITNTRKTIIEDSNIIPIPRGDQRYKHYQDTVKATLHKFSDEAIVGFQFKFSKKCNDFEVTEISFNETFLLKVGFERYEEFVNSLLKRGFPDVIFIEENYHNWYSRMVNNSFLHMIDPRTQKEPMNILLQGAENSRELHEMNVEMINVEIDGFFEIMMILRLKPKKLLNCLQGNNHLKSRKHEAFQTNLTEKIEKSNFVKETLRLDETMKQDRFIKDFYPEFLLKKLKVEPQMCSYKVL